MKPIRWQGDVLINILNRGRSRDNWSRFDVALKRKGSPFFDPYRGVLPTRQDLFQEVMVTGRVFGRDGGAFILKLQTTEMPRQVHSELYINTTSLYQP